MIWEKLLFSLGTLSPPFLAIARRFSKSMEAKPRVDRIAICVSSGMIRSLSELS